VRHYVFGIREQLARGEPSDGGAPTLADDPDAALRQTFWLVIFLPLRVGLPASSLVPGTLYRQGVRDRVLIERESGAAGQGRRGIGSLEVVAGGLVLIVVLQPHVSSWFDSPRLQTWSTVFVSITTQAMPFLVLGVVLSGLIAALVPPGAIGRALPQRAVFAVPVAGLAGMALPGCECSSVPIAGRLVASGAPAPAALAFLLSAPAINPVVLVATAVAFPGEPRMVVARFAASLITSVVVGWVWIRLGRDEWLDRVRRQVPSSGSRVETFRSTAVHDMFHAGGFLVVGGATAATLNALVPSSILDHIASSGPLAVLAMGGLAVVLAVCSEADAFVAASLTQFSLTARLAFLVVGPAVDVKLAALQAGTFGRSFALRFAPLTFVVALVVATTVGTVLL
jgi:uncharacterized membrane protein YraQ (UPF0718 family)